MTLTRPLQRMGFFLSYMPGTSVPIFTLMENVFQIVVDNYEPAADATEADFTPTTEEVLQKVAKHTGKEDLSLEACYIYLKGHNYKTMDLGGLYFVWLLKSRAVLS